MATWTYADSLRRLLVSEGGYSNHPADPGGPTNFGITIIDYRKYVKPDATAADVRGMKADQAKAIYRSKYWDAMRCDELPAGLDYAAFDYGVNSGIGRAGKVLRRMLHLPDNTSTITDEVISAARAADAKATIAALCDERLAFLKGLSTWPVFGRGWGRVAEVRTAALAMAGDASSQAHAPTPASGKGAVNPSKAARNTTVGGAMAVGGAAASQSHGAGMIIIVIAATIGVVATVWLFWRRRQKRRQEASPKSNASKSNASESNASESNASESDALKNNTPGTNTASTSTPKI